MTKSKAVDKANKRAEELNIELNECKNQLRNMTSERDRFYKQALVLENKYFTALEDYHNLAADVFEDQKSPRHHAFFRVDGAS